MKKLNHEQEVVERIKQSDEYLSVKSLYEGMEAELDVDQYDDIRTALPKLSDMYFKEMHEMFIPQSPIYKRISREVQQRREIASTHLNWRKSNV